MRCLALLLSAYLFSVSLAEAATITVDSPADAGPGSLREAIADANDDDVIDFHPDLDGSTIRLVSGQLTITKEITIDASSLNSGITISGESISRVFLIQQNGVTLDSLTIENGKAPDATAGTAPENGGGISFSAPPGAPLTIRRSTVRNNRSGNGHPGGIYTYGGGGGGIVGFGPVLIEESTIHGNRAGNGVSNGSGGIGGGIWVETVSLTIVNSTITGNVAGSGDGTGNGGYCGGVVCGGATLTLTHVTITDNSGGAGATNGFAGGVFLATNADVAHTTNSIIAGNRLSPTGSTSEPAADILVANGFNGGITTSGVNLIGVSDDPSGTYFPEPAIPGELNSNNDLVGTETNPLDPVLGPLGDNEGPTLTHLPLPGASPAIEPVGGDSSTMLTNDQRGTGFVRLVGAKVDIGAVEFTAADQARLDAAAAAEAAAILSAQQAAAAEAALRASLLKKIKKFKKKFKAAKRKGQIAKAKKLKKKFKKFKKKLKSL